MSGGRVLLGREIGLDLVELDWIGSVLIRLDPVDLIRLDWIGLDPIGSNRSVWIGIRLDKIRLY